MAIIAVPCRSARILAQQTCTGSATLLKQSLLAQAFFQDGGETQGL
jgi:hypothetical protein